MEFGMSRRIKPKEKYVRISMKEIWRNLNGPPKNKQLRSYVVKFEFSRPRVAGTVHRRLDADIFKTFQLALPGSTGSNQVPLPIMLVFCNTTNISSVSMHPDSIPL